MRKCKKYVNIKCDVINICGNDDTKIYSQVGMAEPRWNTISFNSYNDNIHTTTCGTQKEAML